MYVYLRETKGLVERSRKESVSERKVLKKLLCETLVLIIKSYTVFNCYFIRFKCVKSLK